LRIREHLPVLSAGGPAPALPTESFGGPAQEEEQSGLSITQIIAMVWAHKKVSLIIALSMLAVGVTAIKFLPKTYTAVASLMVNNDIKDPLAGKDLTMGLQGGWMSTEIQLMQSPEVLLEVVDQLNLVALPEYRAGYRGDGSNWRQWVRDQLYRDLMITQGPQGSLLINIQASARDPFRAAAIANAIADTYIAKQKQRLEGPAIERAQRYAVQLTELKEKVSIAQDQVAAFRQRTGVVDTSQQRSVEADVLSVMQHRLDDAQAVRRAAEVRAMTDTSDTNGAMNSAGVQALKSQLTTQQTQLATLTSTLGIRHPRVQELQTQIEATQRALAAEVKSYSSVASAEVTSARQLERKFQNAIDDQNAKVLALRKLQDEGNKLMLELESAQSVYKRALDGYDQIMFASSGNYNYVNIVSRAEAPQRSSKPNKAKLAFLVLVMSAFFGVAGPLAYELFINRRIRCTDDLERSFGVPVLVQLDAIAPSASPA
jgi:succinoglycan biosynthesis transport protein ExoP